MKAYILLICLVGSTSALSCAPCTSTQVNKCPRLTCHKSERVTALCECCESCGHDLGQMCSERQPCFPNLLCYSVDKDPTLPDFFTGICVTNATFRSLPPEPMNCEFVCEERMNEHEQVQRRRVTTTTYRPTTRARRLTTPTLDRRTISRIVSWVRRQFSKN